MPEQATERMTVEATAEHCFAIATDFDRYPQWAADIKSVTIEERDDEGRGTLVNFRAAAFGRSTSYTLRYDYSDAPRTLAWVQDSGDITSRLDGEYIFEPSEDGAQRTDVTYHLVVELKIPIPGFVKRRAEGRIMGTALRELKARVES